MFGPGPLERPSQVQPARITPHNLRPNLVWIRLMTYALYGAPGNLGIQLDADAVACQPAAFDQRSAAPQEPVEHPVVLFRIAEHQLTGDLRDEIAPVPAEVGAGRVAPRFDPQAVGDDFVVLFPAAQVDVVDRAGLLGRNAARQSLEIVSRPFDRACRQY